VLQVRPQLTPLQVVAPLPEVGHALHELPQLLTLVFDRHALPQRWKPALQVKSHALPEQLGVALAGVVHAAHAPPQSRKPVLQARLHEVPSQLAVPFAALQAVQALPQLLTLVFDRHAFPQR
jgi:hypothetical protein